MTASRPLLSILAVLLTASTLASGAEAARPREPAHGPRTAPPSTPSPTVKTVTHPDVTSTPSADERLDAGSTPATTARLDPTTAQSPRRAATTRTRSRRPASAVPEASSKAQVRSSARTLRPRREPLLARHPAASCALDPLEAVGLRQHDRTRESLREFYWSDMARFFEGSLEQAEPVPTQITDPAFLPTEAVLRDLPAAVRAPLGAVASARVIDRLGEREFNRVRKLLASLGPAQVASLLRADAPTLRGYVWSWLATTKTGGCHLGHLDLEFIEAAVGDRSIAVEHGDDLVYRSLGDYALAARARLATLDPTRFDTFLGRLTGATEIDPLVRATAHGMLLRRAHWDTQEIGLNDPSPPVRAATALAAIEMNRDKVEAVIVEHAASDPADLVTELIVGALLGVHDARARARGLLGTTRDDRLVAAVTRWSGRGDPLEPLPNPQRPRRFAPGPVPQDMPQTPAPSEPAQPAVAASPQAPVPTDSPARPVPATRQARPVPATSEPPAPTPAREPRSDDPRAPPEPQIPGVLDEPGEPLVPGRVRDRDPDRTR